MTSECARGHILPVEEILGKQTLQVIRSIHTADAAILRRPTRPAKRRLLEDRLSAWRKLTETQISELRDLVNDPHSYWSGSPRYRRLPPRPGFAFQLTGSTAKVVLLVDLQNPGWEFFCDPEVYWGFNFAGARLTKLAKTLFPEYASKHSKSVWKKGAIESLVATSPEA